jgi:hypothetical protein
MLAADKSLLIWCTGQCVVEDTLLRERKKIRLLPLFSSQPIHILSQELTPKCGIIRITNGSSATGIQLSTLSCYASTAGTTEGIQLLKPMDLIAE